jgi:hypothetical protein
MTGHGGVVSKRSGPFWDGIEGRAPVPRAASTLGFEFIGADVERGTIEVAFQATELYDTVGPALLVTLGPEEFQSTLELHVKFLRPVRPSRIVGRGRVLQRDADVAQLEASLIDTSDAVIATATASARVIPLAHASGAV